MAATWPQDEEIVVAPPAGPAPPLTHVRGTLITASLATLAHRGLTDRYFASLPREHHTPMKAIIASSWVPEPLTMAHYRACDSLGLSAPEIFAIGAEVGTKIKDTFLGAILRVAREAGTTPWIYLEWLPRLFPRICMGGACAVYRLGPKDARAEWYALPGLTVPYFKTAFRGANQSILDLFCRKSYVSETKPLRGGDWAFKASWA